MADYRIPNLERACKVLRLLAEHAAGLGLVEISQKLKIPRTTALRILSTLTRDDLVGRRESRYVLGSGMIALGTAALRNLDLRAAAAPVVHALSVKVGETAHLAIPSGDRALLVEVAQSPDPIRVGAPAGTLVDLHCSATGKVLLAFGPGGWEPTPRPRRTAKTRVELDDLRDELAHVRDRGYALDDEEYFDGVRCLAAPVRDAHGDVIAALGITATTGRFPVRLVSAHADAVIEHAVTLSASLGCATPASRTSPA